MAMFKIKLRSSSVIMTIAQALRLISKCIFAPPTYIIHLFVYNVKHPRRMKKKPYLSHKIELSLAPA
jgi:hypothetical protein